MLEAISYSPLLHARVAEMKAYTELPNATKDLIFPVIAARPWPNAKKLELTWKRISEAIEGRPFALDLDRTRRARASDKPAQAEFDSLFDQTNGHENYYAAVAAMPRATPVLRQHGSGVADFNEQLVHAAKIDRGIFVRLEYGFTQAPQSIIQSLVGRANDLIIYIDAGWSPNELLMREAWASGIVEQIVSAGLEAEVVLCGSSFPDTFEKIDGRGEIDVDERSFYSDLTRRFNEPPLKYGDYGSTRPPSVDDTPMTPRARIDLPTPQTWVCFRSIKDEDDENEDYQSIAKRILVDSSWPNGLNIWGTYLIEATAGGVPGGIAGPASASASRINIHLHRQAYFDAPVVASDQDEPFEESF
jgi:Beta protein